MNLFRSKTTGKNLRAFLGFMILAAAFYVLFRQLRQFPFTALVDPLVHIPVSRLTASVMLTFLGYLTLTGYDFLAFRYISHPLPYKKMAPVSFMGSALSNNMSPAALAGGAVRYRLYNALGLAADQIAKVLLFYQGTFFLGFFSLNALLFISMPPSVARLLPLSSVWTQVFGLVLFIFVLGYFSLVIFKKGSVRIFNWELRLPSLQLSLQQLVVSSLDWVLASAALYVLLPAITSFSFVEFLGIFLLANIAGSFSQIPGGIGVLEAAVLAFLSPALPAPEIFAALMVYRVIYYLIPLALATILLGKGEFLKAKEQKDAVLRETL